MEEKLRALLGGGGLKRRFTGTVARPNGDVSSEVKQCPLAFLLTTDFAEPLNANMHLSFQVKQRQRDSVQANLTIEHFIQGLHLPHRLEAHGTHWG